MPRVPETTPLTVVVRLTDLLPEFRETIESARTEHESDPGRLNQAVRHAFDFVAPRTVPRIGSVEGEAGELYEVPVLDISGRGERDLISLKRAFTSATRRAERSDGERNRKDVKTSVNA